MPQTMSPAQQLLQHQQQQQLHQQQKLRSSASPATSPSMATITPILVKVTTAAATPSAVTSASTVTTAAAAAANSAVSTTSTTPSTTTTSANGGGGGGGTTEVEEINTKELAVRISAELKRYSIPQAIFAQRVLCRSQGTLSDLLRNPKPWSKLKSGRETFRRMFKWLQEPEFQRMSALRMAGKCPLAFVRPFADEGEGVGGGGGVWKCFVKIEQVLQVYTRY